MPTFINSADSDFSEKLEKSISFDNEVNPKIVNTVSDIVSDVKNNRDSALFSYTKKFENFSINKANVKVSLEEMEEAYEKCDKTVKQALEFSASRIAEYYKKQLPKDLFFKDKLGVGLGWKWTAVESVGVYVPGGKAFYPSSVLMNSIPAKIAGVKRIAMITPTANGIVSSIVLAAAKIAGISEIYKVGGAQGISALAYGTESIDAVDVICGPGNIYVTEAKKQVFGKVGIDMLAGPSEILIISDNKSNPEWLAADLLSQAEHDEDARSILITNDSTFAESVSQKVRDLLSQIDRKEIAKKSWENNGLIVITNNLEEAINISNRIAPEHLELSVDEPKKLLEKINNAGAIFLGRYTPEAVGDYTAGPSHVLPTATTARYSSGIDVFTFLKRSSLIECDKNSLNKVAEETIKLAEKEELFSHALSVKLRQDI